MNDAVLLPPLPARERQELFAAVALLEKPSFVARLAQYAGAPVETFIKFLPGAASAYLRRTISQAIYSCLRIAMRTLEDEEDLALGPASPWTAKLMTGLTGGIGGFFGPLALPIELPITTALMLRGIAEIAREEGEDIRDVDVMLACLEVFALGGGHKPGDDLNLEYYAARMALAELTREAGRYLVERGAINASSPILARLVGEIVTRFGLAVSDRLATNAAPVIGAVGGAAVNVIFMDHFQRTARGHFIVRRLERAHGVASVRAHYRSAALELRLGKQVGS